MQKTILITGSTDGIGLEAAKTLVSQGHHILLHGRNPSKLAQTEQALSSLPDEGAHKGKFESYMADLSDLSDVVALAKSIAEKHGKLDVLINNAGVFNTPKPLTQSGLDVRFVVNTIAPYLLTKELWPLLGPASRVINLSSAAQSPVDIKALLGQNFLPDGAAYAQSKLALTMWSRHMALSMKEKGPVIVAINPKSLLGSKMVKEAYGVAGANLSIGADILKRAALSDEFADASGQYFDNDTGRFASPHPDALDAEKSQEVVNTIERILAKRAP